MYYFHVSFLIFSICFMFWIYSNVLLIYLRLSKASSVIVIQQGNRPLSLTHLWRPSCLPSSSHLFFDQYSSKTFLSIHLSKYLYILLLSPPLSLLPAACCIYSSPLKNPAPKISFKCFLSHLKSSFRFPYIHLSWFYKPLFIRSPFSFLCFRGIAPDYPAYLALKLVCQSRLYPCESFPD